MNDKLFSGLEKFGLNDIVDIDLYKTLKDDDKNKKNTTKELTYTASKMLYDKEITCPVCNNIFKVKAVKTSAYKMQTKDSDFFIKYEFINPYFYDVWLCNSCGYASMKTDFFKIRTYQIDDVKKKITLKWKPRNYSEIYDVDVAIERYKLSLLNYYITGSSSSKKAMACLKIAWMHRIKNNSQEEIIFLNQAAKGFEDAFFKESFPIYGMDKYATTYLIGELNRRIGNNEAALLWFSKVITQHGVKLKLKELARDQRDMIKINKLKENDENQQKNNDLHSSSSKEVTTKKSFLNRLFK